MRGLEPPRLTALAPKASVSTNSTTSAQRELQLEEYFRQFFDKILVARRRTICA
jgi:hypothetical protein